MITGVVRSPSSGSRARDPLMSTSAAIQSASLATTWAMWHFITVLLKCVSTLTGQLIRKCCTLWSRPRHLRQLDQLSCMKASLIHLRPSTTTWSPPLHTLGIRLLFKICPENPKHSWICNPRRGKAICTRSLEILSKVWRMSLPWIGMWLWSRPISPTTTSRCSAPWPLTYAVWYTHHGSFSLSFRQQSTWSFLPTTWKKIGSGWWTPTCLTSCNRQRITRFRSSKERDYRLSWSVFSQN